VFVSFGKKKESISFCGAGCLVVFLLKDYLLPSLLSLVNRFIQHANKKNQFGKEPRMSWKVEISSMDVIFRIDFKYICGCEPDLDMLWC
jgi:hypothetical protein